jgi:hypothetical protein
MTISRRRTLKLAASAAIAPLVAGCASQVSSAAAQVPPGGASEAELEQMALDVMIAENETKAADGAFTWQDFAFDTALRKKITRERVVPAMKGESPVKPGVVLSAVPVEDQDSPNYNHLRGQTSTETFKLNAGVLARVAEANSFKASFDRALGGKQAQSRIVVFGLRGCKLAPGAVAGTMTDEIELTEAAIDHRNMNCVMGVWDRTTNKVSAFTATTVPHLVYMQIFRINLHLIGLLTLNDPTVSKVDIISEDDKNKRQLPWTANMLGQGLHLMSIGKHQGKYDNLLCQHHSWYGPVLRAQADLGYTVKDWDEKKERVGDNIHPTWPVKGWLMDFASAGCNLIEGTGNKAPDYDGPFAVFRKQLYKPDDGLGGDAGDWTTYHYMLLSGREARLHALSETPDPSLKRLKFGSSGEAVRDFQTRLLGVSAAAAKDVFDLGVHFRTLKWQEAEGFAPDGVVTPEQLKLA